MTPVFIDGTSQAGYDPNHPTPMIEVTGGHHITNGLTISSGNSTVKGLVIDSFTGAGMATITNGGNTITATTSAPTSPASCPSQRLRRNHH